MRWITIGVLAALAGLLACVCLYVGVVDLLTGRGPACVAGGVPAPSLAWQELGLAGFVLGGALVAVIGAVLGPDWPQFRVFPLIGGIGIVVGVVAGFVSMISGWLVVGPPVVLMGLLVIVLACGFVRPGRSAAHT